MLGDNDKIPTECSDLFEAVSKTYEDYESEYALIERSLDISSKELTELNQRLHEEIAAANERATKLESLNDMMIDREIVMVDLKKEIKKLQAQLGGDTG